MKKLYSAGLITGINEVKEFIDMAKTRFSKIHFVTDEFSEPGYLKYWILPKNEIKIYQ
jgi:hypothetical protein